MINTLTEITWAYLQILERVKVPLTILAVVIFGITLQMRFVQHRPPVRWLLFLNYGLLIQFLLMLLVWVVVAALFDRNYYYFIFNFFLITWPSLPFLVLAWLLPVFTRQNARV